MRITFFYVLLCAFALTAFAKETLKLDFTKDSAFTVAGKEYKIEGARDDRGLAFGKYGLSFPAASLLGDNQGTVLFKCSFDAPQGKLNTTRTIVQLRTGSRLTVGFHCFSNKTLVFTFSDRAKTYNVNFATKRQFTIQPGKEYMLGFSWDGAKARVYFDGKLVDEAEQPLPLSRIVRNLNIGPYVDGWVRPAPWADDMHIKALALYDEALAPEAVAKLEGIELQPLAKSQPMKLTVPPLQAKFAAKPVIDGKLNDKAWEYAASMPRLIQGNFPQNSGALPPHDFKVTYDAENFYLAFTTLFPPHVPLQEGDVRTADIEPEVWGTESFELYIVNDKDENYRFAGNVAGGYCERLKEVKWNGEWTYKTSKEMKIDDSILWQGEIAIPWKTLNYNGAPKKPVLFNFCRSWKLPDFGNHSSLNITGGAYTAEAMIEMEFAPAPTLQMLSQGNPNTGEYAYEYRIASQNGGKAVYLLALGKLDGTAQPIPLYRREYILKPGEMVQDSHKDLIALPDYDCLVYTLFAGNKAVMREIVPMKLDDNFFDVVPLFLQGKVVVKLKDVVMRSKLGPGFVGTIKLLDKDGKELSKVETSAPALELAFNRDLPKGDYEVALVDKAGKAQAHKKLFYPGYGEWEKMEFPKDVILPPFSAMKTDRKGEGFRSSLSGKEYDFDKGFLPVQVSSQGEGLFAKPAQILLNGKPAEATAFVVEGARPHRVDFNAKGTQVASQGWLEYDGVLWNELTVTPSATSKLDLQFELNPRFAKYLHCAAGATWGSKITRKVEDGTTVLKYFPVLWIGNEEKGLCFFSETHANWNVPSTRTFNIEKNGDKAVLTVRVAEKMQAGKPFKFSFGIMATPVRPLAPNYPFNTLGFGYTDALNRPGRRPTGDVSYICYPPGVKGGDLGSFFGDIDDRDGHNRDNALKLALEAVKDEYNVRPVPYLCARFLSVKYPEVAAYKAEWTIRPEIAMDYSNTGHFVYDCCPTTSASSFFAYRVYKMLQRHPKMKGVYFDFGNVPVCSNENHGCLNKLPLLGMREFYRKIAYVQTLVGIKDPVIVVHNTDCNMFPIYSFTSHLLNGEQVRQASSNLLHNKKDILDTYGIEMFAAELSTLPIGVTNSVYMPFDNLLPKFGGGDETRDAYQFRMGKASLAGTLIHNTITALWRNNFALFDRLIRVYDAFGVDKAQFIGYWREPAKVSGAENIYVSCYAKGDKVLAVVSHVGREHKNQTFKVSFDWKKLNVKNPPRTALDTMTAPDKDYDWLKVRFKEARVPAVRAPLELGDFGSKVISFKGNVLEMSLNYHCFAVVELK
ncbi:MAG: hypothetical protein IKS20_05805 [Victivallales bacterium]|nr:hypothetical protein [Victivallales bacterium]